MIIIYIMRPDAMKVNLFSKISVRNFRVKFQHHRCIKDPVLIPEIHQTLVPLGDRTDGGGSRAEAVMFGRAEPPIFLDRRMAAGVVNGDHDVTGILLGADADKRRAVCTFPTGVEGIFQKIDDDLLDQQWIHGNHIEITGYRDLDLIIRIAFADGGDCIEARFFRDFRRLF